MNSKRSWLFGGLILALVALLAGGCGPANIQLPEGTITNGLLEGSPELSLKAGNYQMVVDTGGVTTIEEEGVYDLRDDQITFTLKKSSDLLVIACTSTALDKPYTYRWAYDQVAGTIKFTNVNDPCDLRRSRRETGGWTYKQ